RRRIALRPTATWFYRGDAGHPRQAVGRPIIVIAIALGLACFAGWLAIDGLTRCRHARGYQRWLLGAGMIGDAVFYAGLMLLILGLVFGWRAGGQHEVQHWAAVLLAQ